MYDVSLNGGQIRISSHALARCNGPAIDIITWDGDEDITYTVETLTHGMPVEAGSIDRGVLLKILDDRIARYADADLGETQDCYAGEIPVSAYGRGRDVYNIRRSVAGI